MTLFFIFVLAMIAAFSSDTELFESFFKR